MSANTEQQKVPLGILTAMVVGSMVGASVFSLPRNFALATGVYGVLLASTIAGVGMLMLAFVFQSLANRKRNLDAGGSRDTSQIRMSQHRSDRCVSPAGVKRSAQNNEE